MAGVACARRLAKDASVRVTLFDTGRRAIGGRASSKAIKLPDGRHVRWDHALSYITASDPRFNEVCAGWVADGLAAPFEGEVVNVDAAAGWKTEPLKEDAPRLVATGNGWHELLERWCDDPNITVVRQAWVATMARGTNGAWTLGGNDVPCEVSEADWVVVAHNGKCAARLVASSKGSAGEPVERALQCAFGIRPRTQLEKQNRLILSSIWSVGVAVKRGGVSMPFEGAHVTGDDALAWCKKNPSTESDVEVWSLLSTAEFGKANKVPQERVPKKKAAEVTSALVGAFARLGGTIDPAAILASRAQLWGAALPLTCTRERSLVDADAGVAVCGDWMGGGDAPSVQSAVLSGEACASSLLASLSAVPVARARPLRFRPTDAGATTVGLFPYADSHAS